MANAIASAFPRCLRGLALPASALTIALVPVSVHAEDAPTKSLGIVVITSTAPTSLPTQIPTTTESITREAIERTVNAVNSEDALKYFPSLLVRKRYIDDYNHAILSTRASGTGNSARSLVFADGIQLSNLLGNGVGGLAYPPRWSMVTPEEIERVDVMYGPFSAAYAGNSAGAVVDYITRMPTRLEGHVSIGLSEQPFKLYATKSSYRSWQANASLGSREGDFAWWLSVSHSDSEGQPLTFPTRLLSAGTASSAGTAVSGAVPGANNTNAPWFILGTGTTYHTEQDHLRLKFAYDLAPQVRATYTVGVWENTSSGRPTSYLTDAKGNPVYSGAININGLAYTGAQALTGGDFALTQQASTHTMHGLSVKSRTRGTWDWELAASLYDYGHDRLRQNAASNPLPAADAGGAGTLAEGQGSGWDTLAARGTWRPEGLQGAHIVDFGAQQDRYALRYQTSTIAGNWITDEATALSSRIQGNTRLRSLWAQDSWRFAADWKAVLGARLEDWSSQGGLTAFSSTSAIAHPARNERHVSPKAALSFQASEDTVLKASFGRAVRFPTVAELYGATSTTNSQYINDPNLRPEVSWTSEFSAEKEIGPGSVRATVFTENVRNALYSQTVFDAAANRNISRVQNVGRIASSGLELAARTVDLFTTGLDLQASLTYTDSIIKENAGFVAVPGDTLGKWQANIPRWRGTALASYRVNDALSLSLGARYSGHQFRTLNNADVNGYTYQGVSKFFTTDVRAQWRIDRQWTASAGIDNLNNYAYWNFHPYPQRSYFAKLKADF